MGYQDQYYSTIHPIFSIPTLVSWLEKQNVAQIDQQPDNPLSVVKPFSLETTASASSQLVTNPALDFAAMPVQVG